MSLPTLDRGLALGILVTAAACGSDPVPPSTTPTPGQVRDFFGLNGGSCWRYRMSSGTNVFATVRVTGPDTVPVSGKSVFIRAYQPPTTSQTNDTLLDVDTTPGEIRLARTAEGTTNRVIKTYVDEPRPLWAQLKIDREQKVVLAASTFTTLSAPREDPANMVEHKWVVLNAADMATTPSGSVPAMKLSYTRSDGGTELYWLVPGFGMAKFTDTNNVDHVVCASRVCDSAGTCTGEASCDDLITRCQ
ncbi:MAG: hypothetical protein IT384_12580 [Deltaproteobacteria bacterium]|nr:hypothetical protein [Deltaproteobacteria bacterium]